MCPPRTTGMKCENFIDFCADNLCENGKFVLSKIYLS